jgi:hypothetical protein
VRRADNRWELSAELPEYDFETLEVEEAIAALAVARAGVGQA